MLGEGEPQIIVSQSLEQSYEVKRFHDVFTANRECHLFFNLGTLSSITHRLSWILAVLEDGPNKVPKHNQNHFTGGRHTFKYLDPCSQL
jgi:hypothetical protein